MDTIFVNMYLIDKSIESLRRRIVTVSPISEVSAMNIPTEKHVESNDVANLVARLLWRALDADDIATYSRLACEQIVAAIDAQQAAIVEAHHGTWRTLGEAGQSTRWPETLVAESLDKMAVQRDAPWVVLPLQHAIGSDRVLVLRFDSTADADDEALLATMASALAGAIRSVRSRRQGGQRIERLEAILEIAATWNRTREMEPLLVRIAEAATSLLGADRASIFLWDKPNRVLVGRPALGMKDNELRIPDDTGVVGRVVQTGQSRRIDRERGQDEIDHDVDEQTGYQTETVLCVPLRRTDGKILGAFEVLNKRDGDFENEDEEALLDLAAHAAIALENTRERQQLVESRSQISQEASRNVQLIGDSPPIQALRSTIQRVADTELAVLITGENGTGKEVVARSIHYLSQRRDQPFVAVNCAAIAETLLESELFGHERGAFTDARESRPGKFELAAGGTLFLDEIGDLSPGGQAKLLRVLEEKIVTRVGGSTPIHTDARVVAATNQDLAEMVRAKRFREDLFYRLNVVCLELPPLRDRGDDVLVLAEHFLEQFCLDARRPTLKLTAAAKRRLVDHTWNGNVRELRNLMERIAYLATDDEIDAGDLDFVFAPQQDSSSAVRAGLTLNEATEQFQSDYIRRAITDADGNMSKAAKRLGLHRSNLYRKMRGLGMEASRAPDEDDEPSSSAD